MAYRLLVDLEVITALDAMPRKTRTRLLDHFRQLRAAPDQHSDDHEQDRVGRRAEINVIAGAPSISGSISPTATSKSSP